MMFVFARSSFVFKGPSSDSLVLSIAIGLNDAAGAFRLRFCGVEGTVSGALRLRVCAQYVHLYLRSIVFCAAVLDVVDDAAGAVAAAGIVKG